MRKLLTILTVLGLAVGISTLSARADGVTYEVSSTYGPDVPATSFSGPGSTFTFVFTVPSSVTGDFGPSGTAGFVDLTSVDVTFSSPSFPSFTAVPGTTTTATISFAPSIGGGLFDIETVFANGDDFLWMFFGPQVFSLNSNGTVATFLTAGSPFQITPGPETLDGSLFANLTDPADLTAGILTGGSVSAAAVTAPEPSSLLLLGSGFLALGGFARKRVITLFN